MKLSKYTIFYKDQEKHYIFNQISNALLKIDNELYSALENKNLQILPAEICKTLENNGFIINDDIDETCGIRYGNLISRYNSKLLRITIIPTLSCNFRCWYCYEDHKASLMTKESAKSILRFIKSEIQNNNIKNVVLDWFGGEPLLRFSQIIYPLSKIFKKWCERNNIIFSNIITTNGSLINDDMAMKMDEINLRQFQITLDGDKEHHNKVRFSPSMKDSYDIIVRNIHTLCKIIKNPNIELRINYTEANIDNAKSILDSFDEDVRNFIHVSPQIVWQESKKLDSLSNKVLELKNKAHEKGYNNNIDKKSFLYRCSVCYVENMEQFVINYNLDVYKCTARDYNGKYCIGKINADGKFLPNNMYYKYYTTQSPFLRKECMECELLPSCFFSIACIQKRSKDIRPNVIKIWQRHLC